MTAGSNALRITCTVLVELGLRAGIGGVPDGATLRITLADSDTARVSFATASGSSLEADAGQVALELQCEAGVTLQVDASARVSDLGTGTAALLADYAAFPEQTISLPAGSAAGAVQNVSLALLEDATSEVDETILLGLSQPSPVCTLGAIQTHVLTIEDDDFAGDAAFQASEGSTGTENMLAFDESIDLGTDGVVGGPNAGTLLRVANLGAQPMALGTPLLAGTHPNDFAIELESSSFVARFTRESAGPSRRRPRLSRPWSRCRTTPTPGVVLRVEPAEFARMRKHATAALKDAQETPDADEVTLLDGFQAAWSPPNGSWPVQANLAHFLSGADLGGGLGLGSAVPTENPGSRSAPT